MHVYGCFPSPEQQKQDEYIERKKLYKYLQSKIKTELLNPEPDYDNEREVVLLKMVAVSDLHFSERILLVNIILNEQIEE